MKARSARAVMHRSVLRCHCHLILPSQRAVCSALLLLSLASLFPSRGCVAMASLCRSLGSALAALSYLIRAAETAAPGGGRDVSTALLPSTDGSILYNGRL